MGRNEPSRSRTRADLSKVARGRWGERRAATEYRRLGYEILATNWRGPDGELDLIVRRDGGVVFSEVKTRRSDRYGPAAAAVTPSKQRTIRALARTWLDEHQPVRSAVRFDVVAITGVHVEIIDAAF